MALTEDFRPGDSILFQCSQYLLDGSRLDKFEPALDRSTEWIRSQAKGVAMGIWSFFTQRRHARIVAQTANDVAGRSHAAVLDRVRRRAGTMRVSEARGYVRSRALDIVHRELAAVHNGKITLDPATQTDVISQATEAVVVRVMAELRNVPKGVRPDKRPDKRRAA